MPHVSANPRARSFTGLAIAALFLAVFVAMPLAVMGQTLDERLDDAEFLQGLADYGLDDLLEFVLETRGEDDPATAHLVRITRLRRSVGDAAPGSRDRSEAIERLLAARRSLLTALPRDWRFPRWQTDLALDLLTLAVTHQGIDLAAEFGIVDQCTKQRLRDYVQEAFNLADEAAIGVSDAILDIEEAPDFAENAALQQQRRRLVNFEQRLRIPFALETARYAVAALEDPTGEDETRQLELVTRALQPLAAQLPEPLGLRAQATYGLALARLGRADEARAALTPIVDRSDAEQSTRFRAAMGLVIVAGQARSGGSAAITLINRLKKRSWIRENPFWSLLLADRAFLLTLGDAATTAGHTSDPGALISTAAELERFRQAMTAYDDFLANDQLPLDRSAREAAVGDRLAILAPSNVAPAQLPVVMALARAERAIRTAGEFDRGMSEIEALLRRSDLSPDDRPRVLIALATGYRQAGRDADAAEALLDLARNHRTSSRAADAAQGAAVLALTLHEMNPDSAEAVDLLNRSLSLVLEEYAALPDIDHWAYEKGKFEERRGRLDQAVSAFGRVSSEAGGIFTDARFRIATLQLDLARRAGSEGRTTDARRFHLRVIQGAQNARSAAQKELAAPAQFAESAARTRRTDLEYYLVACDLIEAESELAGDLPRRAGAVLALLSGFESKAGSRVDLIGRGVLLRVRALQFLDRHDEADAELHALAQRSPAIAIPALERIVVDLFDVVKRLQIDAGEDDEAVQLAQQRLVGLADLLVALAAGGPTQAETSDAFPLSTARRFTIRLHQAEAHRLAGDYRASLGMFERLSRERQTSAEALFGSAECLYALDRDTEAIKLFKVVASGLVQNRDWMFWQSELRALQILDRQGRGTAQIFPRIQRLRRMDAALGGDRLERSFTGLELKYAP